MTFRVYDVEAREWVLHWLDRRTLQMDKTPVRGKFDSGLGEFLSEDTHDGIPIVCRYRWTVMGPESATWEQAFWQDLGDQLDDGGDPHRLILSLGRSSAVSAHPPGRCLG
jgi:hypothetical protein